MATENKSLQEKRKLEIPTIIEKYKKLIDEIYIQVGKAIPDFKDKSVTVPGGKDEESREIMISAEQQTYDFILMRERAVDYADRISIKINQLQIELYAPELLLKSNDEETEVKNPTKKHAKQ